MRHSYVLVQNNVVENVITLDDADDYTPAAGLAIYPFEGDVGPGWFWNDGAPAPASEAVPVPTSITRRQLLLVLLQDKMITADEALAAAQVGAVPAAIQAYFGQLPADERVAAEITWATMSGCDRSSPLLAALTAHLGIADAQVDEFFRQASRL